MGWLKRIKVTYGKWYLGFGFVAFGRPIILEFVVLDYDLSDGDAMVGIRLSWKEQQ